MYRLHPAGVGKGARCVPLALVDHGPPTGLSQVTTGVSFGNCPVWASTELPSASVVHGQAIGRSSDARLGNSRWVVGLWFHPHCCLEIAAKVGLGMSATGDQPLCGRGLLDQRFLAYWGGFFLVYSLTTARPN